MTEQLHLMLGTRDWFDLFLYYLSLSLLSIGGAITTAPDMHRFLVGKQHWLTDTQFNASIVIAHAAPGPNALFITLPGWNVGLNAGGVLTGMAGALVALMGIWVPSTMLTYVTAQWAHRNRKLRAVRTFNQGMAPIVVALLMATTWILASANGSSIQNWPIWLVTAASALVVWRTRLQLLWLLAAGAILGVARLGLGLGWFRHLQAASTQLI